MLASLSIKKRVTLGFIAVIALLLTLAGIAGWKVSTVDANLAQMSDINSVKQRYAINFRASVHDRAISVRDVVLAKTPSEAQKAIDEIRSLEAIYAQSAGPLDEMLAPATKPAPEELQILARIKATERETNARVTDVLARQKAGDSVNADRILRLEAAPLFVQWLGQIDEFIDLQEARNQDISVATRTTTGNFTLILAVLCVGAVLMSFLIVRWSTSSLRKIPELANTIQRLASGSRETSIPGVGEQNELGGLATSIQSLQDELRKSEVEKKAQAALIVEGVGSGLEKLASGDLKARVTADLTGPFAKLKSDFNIAVEALEKTICDLSGTAATTNTGAQEVSAASDDLSDRTQQQAGRLEETAASMSQITTLIKQTADKATEARDAIHQTDNEARDGGSAVAEAVEAMAAIKQSSTDITQIIDVIDGIAFQTNLLALNAGVEAARAGETGKGFAVVANEVRALAQRSAEAAQDIKDLITKSSAHVDSGVNLVGKTGSILQTIVDQIGEVSSQVSDIAQMTHSQADNITQVNSSVGEMDRMTQQNAAMVEETNAAARNMSSEAKRLANIVARFEVSRKVGDTSQNNKGQPKSSRQMEPASIARHAETTSAPIPEPRIATPVASNLALKQDVEVFEEDQDWSEF